MWDGYCGLLNDVGVALAYGLLWALCGYVLVEIACCCGVLPVDGCWLVGCGWSGVVCVGLLFFAWVCCWLVCLSCWLLF